MARAHMIASRKAGGTIIPHQIVESPKDGRIYVYYFDTIKAFDLEEEDNGATE